MGSTPEYTKQAISRYNAKFDRVAVNLPKGTKDRVKRLTGESCNAYINRVVAADLDRLEQINQAPQEPEEFKAPFED